jgi:hypothetical protein
MRATHVYHGIKIPGRRSRFSAWWIGDPRGPLSGLAYIVDGERLDAAGRSYPLTAADIAALEHGPWSARIGRRFRSRPLGGPIRAAATPSGRPSGRSLLFESEASQAPGRAPCPETCRAAVLSVDEIA